MTQPTGVFVRLPLDEAQIMKLYNPKKSGNENLLAIGTPVTGGELEVVGYIPEHPCLTKRDGTNASTFEDRENKRHTVPLVRQSDALAKLAEKDAKIARLREYYEASEALTEVGLFNATPEMFARERSARKALKGPEA